MSVKSRENKISYSYENVYNKKDDNCIVDMRVRVCVFLYHILVHIVTHVFLLLDIYIFFRFLAETPGTHFWHAHAGLQRADGVFGALVIRQPKSRDYHSALYDHDLPEHSILLNDWIGEMGASRFAGHHHAMTEHLPESILINGW